MLLASRSNGVQFAMFCAGSALFAVTQKLSIEVSVAL
jgi:hypothetical protein